MRDTAEDKAHASKCSVAKAPSILGSGSLGSDVASHPVSSLMGGYQHHSCRLQAEATRHLPAHTALKPQCSRST
jgi:hypothetical protein